MAGVLLCGTAKAQVHNVGLYWCDDVGVCTLVSSQHDPDASDQPSSADEFTWSMVVEADGGGGDDTIIQSMIPENDVGNANVPGGDGILFSEDDPTPLPRVIVRADAPRRAFVGIRLGFLSMDIMGRVIRYFFGKRPGPLEVDYSDDQEEALISCSTEIWARIASVYRAIPGDDTWASSQPGVVIVARMVDGNTDTWLVQSRTSSTRLVLVGSTCSG